MSWFIVKERSYILVSPKTWIKPVSYGLYLCCHYVFFTSDLHCVDLQSSIYIYKKTACVLLCSICKNLTNSFSSNFVLFTSVLVLSFWIINIWSVQILLGPVYQNDLGRNWIKLSSAVIWCISTGYWLQMWFWCCTASRLKIKSTDVQTTAP